MIAILLSFSYHDGTGVLPGRRSVLPRLQVPKSPLQIMDLHSIRIADPGKEKDETDLRRIL